MTRRGDPPVFVWGWLKRPEDTERERIEDTIRHGVQGAVRRKAILSFLSNGNRLALNCQGGISRKDHDLKVLARKEKIQFIRIGYQAASRRTYAVRK